MTPEDHSNAPEATAGVIGGNLRLCLDRTKGGTYTRTQSADRWSIKSDLYKNEPAQCSQSCAAGRSLRCRGFQLTRTYTPTQSAGINHHLYTDSRRLELPDTYTRTKSAIPAGAEQLGNTQKGDDRRRGINRDLYTNAVGPAGRLSLFGHPTINHPNKDIPMTEITTTTAASEPVKAPRNGKAKTKPPGSEPTHLWLGPAEQKTLDEAAEAVARITNVRESWAVLLRAGISALTDEVKLVEAEQKRSKETGRREWRLRHALARANFSNR
jgi:hypothetical protein